MLSILSTYQETCPSLRLSNTDTQDVFYILCGLNTTRILRALKFQYRFEMIEDEVQRFLAKMTLNIVIMILFSTLPPFSSSHVTDMLLHHLCIYRFCFDEIS